MNTSRRVSYHYRPPKTQAKQTHTKAKSMGKTTVFKYNKKSPSFFSSITRVGTYSIRGIYQILLRITSSARTARKQSTKNNSARHQSTPPSSNKKSPSYPQSYKNKTSSDTAPWYISAGQSLAQHPAYTFLTHSIKRITIVQLTFVVIFGIIVWKLADLQITNNAEQQNLFSPSLIGNQIILARRGQIYFKDMSQSRSDIPLTSTVSLAHVFFDAAVLKEQVSKEIITLEKAAMMVASALNISYTTIYELFKSETAKDPAPKYVIITKFVDAEQKKAVEYLRFPTYTLANEEYIPPFNSWLNFESVESRFYPENTLLASTVGYVPRHYATAADALNAGCHEMVTQNEQRQTVNTYIPGDNSKGQYMVGYYGIEQKFCSELGGLNGKKPLNKDLNTEKEEASRVKNGSDVYLTIDRNIQRQAETILQQAIDANTNSNGAPTDGSIVVMEVKTGRILAMASYPTFNPNSYTKANPAAFRNVSTSGDYDPGSVMKPLTVAAALNEWETGSVDSQGNRLGVPADWTFTDYDAKGKPYQENNGRIFYIRNSQNLSWKDKGPQNLSNVLRDSINTGIAEIQPRLGNIKTREYFEERFLFGKKTIIDLPGDTSGNVYPLTENINSPFTYATFGFGQGFTVSPIQLARAYSALANNGKRVEPILVDKIVHDDGSIETTNTEGSVIQQPAPQQIISPTTAQLVTGYLVNTIDQGYLGAKPSKGQVPGYTIAGKTGTSEVGRAPKISCGSNVGIYDCNTSQGIYDHTYVGYGPAKDPQIIVVVKLSEPKKGEVSNFAENTTGPYFSAMMKYTLEYLGVPKEPGR